MGLPFSPTLKPHRDRRPTSYPQRVRIGKREGPCTRMHAQQGAVWHAGGSAAPLGTSRAMPHPNTPRQSKHAEAWLMQRRRPQPSHEHTPCHPCTRASPCSHNTTTLPQQALQGACTAVSVCVHCAREHNLPSRKGGRTHTTKAPKKLPPNTKKSKKKLPLQLPGLGCHSATTTPSMPPQCQYRRAQGSK
jgi:hypothetical protein